MQGRSRAVLCLFSLSFTACQSYPEVIDNSAVSETHGDASTVEQGGRESKPSNVIDIGKAGQGGFAAGGSGGQGPRESYCGDGVVDLGEQCDDGNAIPGEGCDGNCQLEANYKCPTPGAPCASTIRCGDMLVNGAEACDDGNVTSGDGCSATCTREAGYTCPTPTEDAVGGPCTKVLEPVCGDGRKDPAEACDDGNTTANDGCTGCTVDAGYQCPEQGKLCTLVEWCGDVKVSLARGEECDDGNDGSGDGCTPLCQIEANFSCPSQGGPCTSLVACGDGKRMGSETCDDKNRTDGDGCSTDCQTELGWVCPPGAPCRAEACGDGRVVDLEECDDGNQTNGDGCSDDCELEEGYACPTTGGTCHRTTCHDNLRETNSTEQCEDNNYDTGDGCSPLCKLEPKCSGGTCQAVCGDGLKLQTEDCDDGNLQSGDGCSTDCKVEPGFVCEIEVAAPVLPIVYRDFVGTRSPGNTGNYTGNTGPIHPDFEYYGTGVCNTQREIVATTTDAQGKPVLSDPNGCATDTASFAQWYRSDQTINRTLVDLLTFQPVTGTANAYQYADTTFFPLTGRGWNDPANPATEHEEPRNDNTRTLQNFHFTSELRYWFTYQGGERLTFFGDDDVWVFVNGHLAVDIAGIHGQRERWIQLAGNGTEAATGAGTLNNADQYTFGYPDSATLDIHLGGIYDVVVFQAERHVTQSSYQLTLQNFLSGVSQCQSVCGDGIVTRFEACDLGKDPATGQSLNTGAYGTCNPDCTLPPYCGDGRVAAEEQCDDGVNQATYSTGELRCGPDCHSAPRCGDGALNADHDEKCDDGAANGTASSQCTTLCQLKEFCGDGVLNAATEECDTGAKNGTTDSSCAADCKLKCGNGVVEVGEECDLGKAGNVGGYDGCTAECKRGPYCGDKLVQAPEQCDDGTAANTGTYGSHCTPTCTRSPYCGDGTVNGPEECDLGSANQQNPYGKEQCTTRCKNAPFCGDGFLDTEFGERCEGTVSCEGCRPVVT